MKQKYTSYTFLILALFGMLIAFTGCEGEHFVDAQRVNIWNYNEAASEIFVDGVKVADFDGFHYAVYLNSGEYTLSVKQEGKEIETATIKLSAKTEGNNDRFSFVVSEEDKNYAYLDVRKEYFPSSDYEVEATYFGENFLHMKSNTYRVYYPWSTLPMQVYSQEGGTTPVYQLFEVPASLKDADDDAIIEHCSKLIK